MHAVRARQDGHVHSIIDDDRDAVTRASLADVVDPLQQLAIPTSGLSNLDDIGPCREGLIENDEGIEAAQPARQQKIDARVEQPFPYDLLGEGHVRRISARHPRRVR